MTAPTVPDRISDEPHVLAAWYYGPDGFFGHYRKVMLAMCAELIRASHTGKGRMTDKAADNLAHTHPAYLKFLEDHLAGRMKWMDMFLKNGGIGG